MLLETISNTATLSLHNIADYFYVTDKFLMQKLKFLSKQKPIWKLDENKYLCLYMLHSVYIYNVLE